MVDQLPSCSVPMLPMSVVNQRRIARAYRR